MSKLLDAARAAVVIAAECELAIHKGSPLRIHMAAIQNKLKAAIEAETAAGEGSRKASTDPEDMASDINEMAAELDSRCGCEFPRDYHDPRIEPLKECTYHGAILATLTAAQARIAELEECVQECAAWWLGINGDGEQAHAEECTQEQQGRKHLPCDCPKRLIDAALLGEGEKP